MTRGAEEEGQQRPQRQRHARTLLLLRCCCCCRRRRPGTELEVKEEVSAALEGKAKVDA